MMVPVGRTGLASSYERNFLKILEIIVKYMIKHTVFVVYHKSWCSRQCHMSAGSTIQ